MAGLTFSTATPVPSRGTDVTTEGGSLGHSVSLREPAPRPATLNDPLVKAFGSPARAATVTTNQTTGAQGDLDGEADSPGPGFRVHRRDQVTAALRELSRNTEPSPEAVVFVARELRDLAETERRTAPRHAT